MSVLNLVLALTESFLVYCENRTSSLNCSSIRLCQDDLGRIKMLTTPSMWIYFEQTSKSRPCDLLGVLLEVGMEGLGKPIPPLGEAR